MNNKVLRIGIIAGEHSGDILGAGLIKAIKAINPNVQFEGIAGPRMKALGCHSYFAMEELAVMGIFEVLPKLKRLLNIKKEIVQHFVNNPPDVFIGIDAPDFNLRVEKPLKEAGIKTVQYVSPSVWAWRKKRIFKIADATNLVLALLPFEKAFYDEHQVPCKFVGHTLADELPLVVDQDEARNKLGLSQTDKVLALLPGSRGSEVKVLSEPYIQSAKLLKKKIPELKIVVPFVNDKRKTEFCDFAQKLAPELDFIMLNGQSREAMQAADAILLASGTATLEAMFFKKPMVVGYRLKPLTYHLLNTFFTFDIKYFSLPNLLADDALVPELFQAQLTADNLVEKLEPYLLEDQTKLKKTFMKMHETLRLDASNEAAKAVLELIKQGAY